MNDIIPKHADSWFNRRGWRDIIIAAPYMWLILFFLLPFVIVVVMSFCQDGIAITTFCIFARVALCAL